MTVRELIEELEQFDGDTQVFFNVTKEGAQLFHFVEVVAATEVELESRNNIILLESETTDIDTNPN